MTLRNLNRRAFIESLSRTALVLPFADIVSLAGLGQAPAPQQVQQPPPKIGPTERSYDAKAAPPPPGPKSPIEGTPLGVSFVEAATESGLTGKTIYGGELKNKYLLETTGCGLAFYDYDHDGWLDLFLVNGWRLEGFRSVRGWNTNSAGVRPAVWATTTTMASTICLSLTTDKMRSTATTATGHSRM
ncbi:MAG: hypothetical protein ABSF53_10805 [Terracidiphilus sp.]